jgi:hypothetical protein
MQSCWQMDAYQPASPYRAKEKRLRHVHCMPKP